MKSIASAISISTDDGKNFTDLAATNLTDNEKWNTYEPTPSVMVKIISLLKTKSKQPRFIRVHRQVICIVENFSLNGRSFVEFSPLIKDIDFSGQDNNIYLYADGEFKDRDNSI